MSSIGYRCMECRKILDNRFPEDETMLNSPWVITRCTRDLAVSIALNREAATPAPLSASDFQQSPWQLLDFGEIALSGEGDFPGSRLVHRSL